MDKKNYTFEKNNLYGARAERLIPGGGHTYSKGSDQFPANAPKIIDRGLGCKLWDVDGNEFLDLAMSLGAVTLGHAYPPVIEAVAKELKKGVNFCRPSIIEGELAELMTDIIPGAEMVKFGKNGSDAVTAAVKLARAATGRKYIARCAQDPFNAIHDWFIGSTVVNRGIPEEVRKLTIQFNFNDLPSCQKLIDDHPGEIACFILEPLSLVEQKDNFLANLKLLCEKNGIVLIFDEVVSGFRFDLGGAAAYTGVTPHLAAFGKAMANGFSVSALTGKRELMELGGITHKQERVFLLSTTHGGETHEIAAAIASIKEIMRTDAIRHIWWFGDSIKAGVKKIAEDLKAEHLVHTIGFGCRPGIVFKDQSGAVSMAARTVFLQETVARGLLIPYIVPTLAHQQVDLAQALEIIHDGISVVKNADAQGRDIKELLLGEPTKPVFRKFN